MGLTKNYGPHETKMFLFTLMVSNIRATTRVYTEIEAKLSILFVESNLKLYYGAQFETKESGASCTRNPPVPLLSSYIRYNNLSETKGKARNT